MNETGHSIQLIAADLDGTLINHQGKLSPSNLRALHRVQQRGIEFVPVSARPRFGIEHALGTFDHYSYVVAFNGAYVVDRLAQRVLLDLRMEAGDVREILKLINAYRFYAGFYLGDEFYAELEGEGADLESSFQGRQPTFVSDLRSLATMGANKIIVIELQDHERLAAFHEQAIKAFPQFNVSLSSDRSIEISHHQASKGSGLQYLAERLNISGAHIAVVGDNFNDLSMLQFAGTSVAMGDAPEAVKQAADLVVGPCDADGAAEAIERILQMDHPEN